ncbi:hypothetical protein AVEN_248884-1 [Araneus ventricosus]|uniref:Uncharacterized protein n=1 Tax=Araneus ventricosus TaxID=182803 RepID=A0A4Y2V7L0_ARAVE|nr:hypothetical protein AVEN_248884-1 [Araneus ventricosus]
MEPRFPMPEMEPGQPGRKPGILTTRPHGSCKGLMTNYFICLISVSLFVQKRNEIFEKECFTEISTRIAEFRLLTFTSSDLTFPCRESHRGGQIKQKES